MQFSKISQDQLEFLHNDIRIKMNLRKATFRESKIDKVIKDIDKYTMVLPESPLPLEDALVGQVDPELIGLLVYTIRSYDIRKKKFNPKHIRVHKLCQLGSFINTTLYDLYQQANSSYNRRLLDLATNEIKDLIQKRSPPYEFNTISKGQSLIASFRTPQHFGRQLIATPYRSDPLSEKVIRLEQKNAELRESIRILDLKCNKIEDLTFPSIVDISTQDGCFDLIGDALLKSKNLELVDVFRKMEQKFTTLTFDENDSFNNEKYTAFAITRNASITLINHFILNTDGTPVTNPNYSALRKTMEYHIIKGELTSHDLRSKSILTSYNGLHLTIRVDGNDIFVNGSKIIDPDKKATNGIVHVIDKMLDFSEST